MTEAAPTAPGSTETFGNAEFRLFDPNEDQLSDAVAAVDRKRFFPEVEQDDLDLPAVVGVDRAG